ncbi:hypothetical protein ACWF94_13175 [Streptomyces sp. NPDC055078]
MPSAGKALPEARTRKEFTAFSTGWTLLEDGIVSTTRWNPDQGDDRHRQAARAPKGRPAMEWPGSGVRLLGGL